MDPQKIVVDMLPARPIRQVLVSYSATLGIEIEGSRVERLCSSLMGEESLPCRVRNPGRLGSGETADQEPALMSVAARFQEL
jgi:hypothetical protein